MKYEMQNFFVKKILFLFVFFNKKFNRNRIFLKNDYFV